MFYRIMRWIVYPFIRIFIRVEHFGMENVPKNKGYILAANHTSIADMFVIAVPVKGQICYMAKEEIFKIKNAPLKKKSAKPSKFVNYVDTNKHDYSNFAEQKCEKLRTLFLI